jgi:hypothetical protein
MENSVFGDDPLHITFIKCLNMILPKIEGVPSFILAVCVFFFLPSRPDLSKYINEKERLVCLARLNSDSLAEGDTGINWTGVKRALTDWKTYVIAVGFLLAAPKF